MGLTVYLVAEVLDVVFIFGKLLSVPGMPLSVLM